MAGFMPNGTKYAFSTAYGTAQAISAISNASVAVATATTPPTDDSVVVVTSGWTELTDNVAVTDEATATTFKMVGINTSDTKRFPAGEGAGTFKTVTAWQSIDQIRDVSMTGGEQQFFNYQYVEDPSSRERQTPTNKNAMSMTINLDYDPDKAWYSALIEADRKREPVVLRSSLPSGDTMYYYGYLSFNKVGTGGVNEHLQNVCTFSLLSDPYRVAG
jgi:hypothetical protein